MRNRMIRAVFFDMDGTLVHPPPGFSEASFLRDVLRKLGVHVALEQVEQAYREEDAWYQEHFQDFTRWTRDSFVEYDRRLLSRMGLDRGERELLKLARQVEDHWKRFPEEAGELLYPEVTATLEEFQGRGFILGIVSHRPLASTQSSLRRHHIGDYFRVMVSPQVAPAPRGKLDSAMWEYALQQAHVPSVYAAHIGDLYEYDVVGARAAGLLPVLVDRDHKYPQADCLRAADLLQAAHCLLE